MTSFTTVAVFSYKNQYIPQISESVRTLRQNSITCKRVKEAKVSDKHQLLHADLYKVMSTQGSVNGGYKLPENQCLH